MSDDFKNKDWNSPPQFGGPWCSEHENEIKNIRKDNEELWREHEINETKIEKHREDLDGLKNTVYGVDGSNGLRGKCREFQTYIDILRPEHLALMEKLNEFHAFKKSVGKIIWLLIATLAITLFTNWSKMQSDDTKVQTLQNIQTEVSKILEDRLKHPAN